MTSPTSLGLWSLDPDCFGIKHFLLPVEYLPHCGVGGKRVWPVVWAWGHLGPQGTGRILLVPPVILERLFLWGNRSSG